MQKIILALFILTSPLLFGQDYQAKKIDYDGIDLHPPMKIELILSGNFGEMRSNHFHTGLDIKTQGVEGQKLYAAEDGVISRIRVSPWGYGLALYIDHPKIGLTTLYAHMSAFTPEIDSLVYAYQKKNESYIVDEVVLEDKFRIKKGQLIGYSGNSGSSYAPHLHYEVRETSTEHALNPLLFKSISSKIADTKPPTLSGIKLYAVTEKGYLIPGKSVYYKCKYLNNKWVVNNGDPIDLSELYTENSYLALGFHVTDQLNGAGNVCGVYNTQFLKGEDLLHEQKTEYMNFDHNRFLNGHQDYFEFDQRKRNIHKNFKTIINPLPIYPYSNGLIPWNEVGGKYTLKAEDAHGNKIDMSFNLKKPTGQPAKNPFDASTSYYYPDSVNTLLQDDFQALMEPSTFYEPVQKIYRIDSIPGYLTPAHQFGEYAIPLHLYFDVRMKVPDLPEGFPIYKLGIGMISEKGYFSFLGGEYVKGWVESKSRSFGKFVMVVDTIPPVISPLDFDNNKDISRYRNMQLELADNLSGISTYKAYINEAWVLMEYDRRKRKYIIPLDERSKPLLRKGENKVRIYVKDRKGNESENVWTVIY